LIIIAILFNCYFVFVTVLLLLLACTNRVTPVTVDLIKSLGNITLIKIDYILQADRWAVLCHQLLLIKKYPDMFAGAMLVAGQWDPTKVTPLKNNLWIVVSQGDAKAYLGMNAITNTLEKEGGAKVSRAIWDGRANESEFTYDVI
jgi:predicted peptidase